MRFVVSTNIAKGFNTFLREAINLGFGEIELVSEHINEENLSIIDRLSKLDVSSIKGEVKNYKYYLYLAQSLNVEFLTFDIGGYDKQKLARILKDAENMGVKVAVENHTKEEGFPYKPEDMRKFTEMGAFLLLDTAKAKTVVSNLSSFTKMFGNEIVGFRVSDFYKGFGHLPFGMGEKIYLEPVLKDFSKTKKPMIITLKDTYNLIDAWMSKENLVKYYKSLPKT